MLELISTSFRKGISMTAKINIWRPFISKTPVKSSDQYRVNESRAVEHGGGANCVLGGMKPFFLSIFRTVFFETRIPVCLSSSEIIWAPQTVLQRFIFKMRSTMFSWMGGRPLPWGSPMILNLVSFYGSYLGSGERNKALGSMPRDLLTVRAKFFENSWLSIWFWFAYWSCEIV